MSGRNDVFFILTFEVTSFLVLLALTRIINHIVACVHTHASYVIIVATRVIHISTLLFAARQPIFKRY